MDQPNHITTEAARELRENNDEILIEIYTKIRHNIRQCPALRDMYFNIPLYYSEYIINALRCDNYKVVKKHNDMPNWCTIKISGW